MSRGTKPPKKATRSARRRPQEAPGRPEEALPPTVAEAAQEGARRPWRRGSYSRQEKRRRILTLERFMRQGRDVAWLEAAMEQIFQLGPNGTKNLIQQVYDKWAVEFSKGHPHERPRQVHNLNELIRTLTKDESGNALPAERVAKNAFAIGNAMRLLAQMTGTMQPLRVDVSVSQAQAAGAVMATLTEAQIAEMAEEYDRGQRAIAQLEDGTEVLEKKAALRVVKDDG